MPDLQSCYFCGTPDSVQEYAVIPPRFTPDGESPQSAVLCEQCKTKLLQVIEPLTEQLDSGSRSSAGTTPSATQSADSTQPDEPAESGITKSSSENRGVSEGGADDGVFDEGVVDDGEVDDADATSASSGPSAEEASTPPNYRRAMRMLSNREFPLDRSEVESMLAGAYDLERHEVNAVLDHAIEEGRLVEDDGQFHEP